MENNYKQTSVVKLRFEFSNGQTVMKDSFFTSPFKIIKPFKKERGFLNTMIMSSSAGIMAGDRQEIEISVGKDCNVEISSQSYEKIHKMNEGEAKRKAAIEVASGATLIYMPQPTIPFEDSAFVSNAKVNLEDKTSKLIYCEVLTSGRVHSGESFLYEYYKNAVDIYCDDTIIYKDNAYFEPKKQEISGLLMYEGYTHLASQVICNFDDGVRCVSIIRDYLNGLNEDIEFGVSDTAFGDVAVRILGRSADKLEQILKEICVRMLEG